jgi:hypothetical protein
MFFYALLAFAAIVVLVAIVQEWQKGALIATAFRELARRPFFLILVGLVAAFLALVAVLWILGILWAWIMLPFTLREGVAAVNGLRLEVRRLRRRMFPTPATRDDDFDDLDG